MRQAPVQTHINPILTNRQEQKLKEVRVLSQSPPLKNALRNIHRSTLLNETCSNIASDPVTGKPPIITLDVIEFVREELQEAQMAFSVNLFKRVFDLLLEIKPGFQKFLEQRLKDIDATCEQMRNAGRERIRESDMSVMEIKREEDKIEHQINDYRESTIKELTKDYPGRIMGSHEDNDIRNIAFELILEKHHLSNIYLKDGTTELEEDKLNTLILRAIDEWKNEIINIKIKDLFDQFRKISGKGDVEKEQSIQAELTSLMSLRSEMAKCIGERIIFNGRR